MRTEEQLRTTLLELADQPHAADDLAATILARTTRRPVVRRRVTLVVALAAIALIAAIAVPSFLVKRTVVPADQRVPGNWNLTHQVTPLPDDWQVRNAMTSRTEEILNVGPITASPEDQSNGCDVRINAPGVGAPDERAPQSPVEVAGRPGVWIAGEDMDHLPGVYWHYTENAWAFVGCATKALSLDIAGRVRPALVETRLPFRLATLPTGYQVEYVAPPRIGSEAVEGAMQLLPTEKGSDRPGISVVLRPGRTEVPAHIPGWETAEIGGRPAVLSAQDGLLCLNPTGHTLCIEAGGGEPADLNVSYWAAGRRELLVGVAEQLTLADDLDQPSRWYEANATIPS